MSTATADKLLTPIQAAEFLSVKVQTLALWRMTHRHGLPFVRVGHLIRYRTSDLESWLESRTVTPSTEADNS